MVSTYRNSVHECWMKGNAESEDCANCLSCIDEPYEMSEFIPQLRAMARVWRKGKAKGWTRQRGKLEPQRHWILQAELVDKQGHTHWLNAGPAGNVWFSPVQMNCF